MSQGSCTCACLFPFSPLLNLWGFFYPLLFQRLELCLIQKHTYVRRVPFYESQSLWHLFWLFRDSFNSCLFPSPASLPLSCNCWIGELWRIEAFFSYDVKDVLLFHVIGETGYLLYSIAIQQLLPNKEVFIFFVESVWIIFF